MDYQSSLLDTREAAQRLNVSVSCMAKWRISGFGPKFCKLGKAVRYRVADLDEFVAKSSATSTVTAGGASLGGDSR